MMFFKKPVNTRLALAIFAAPGAILLFGLMPSLLVGAPEVVIGTLTALNAVSLVVVALFWAFVPSPDPNA